jgi:transcriptional regulator with XRE-family HTH domain
MEHHVHLVPDRRMRTTMLYLARILAGTTQQDLARAAGIKQGTLSGYERGLKPPTLAAATRLAIELDLPLELIGREVEMVAVDLPTRLTATDGEVVAVVRIAPTAPASEQALEAKDEAAFTTNAASDSHAARQNSARNRNARVLIR